MRTAEEILINEFDSDKESLQTAIILNADVRRIERAINEARKEAIEECAKRAQIIRYQENRFADYESALGNVQIDQVDKQSILSLIKQLK